jgi:hypothetical protein
MNDLIREGENLVAIFLAAQTELERQKSVLSGAECELRNAESELAKWLMPDDMQPGEKIAVWRGDSLFQVELEPHTSYPVGDGEPVVSYEPKVTVRSRGKHFSDLRRRA